MTFYAVDATIDEMRDFLKKYWSHEDDAFEIEEAMYWFAADYHGGQGSNLYAALSLSEFTPGLLANGPQSDLSLAMYDSLKEIFGPLDQ